MSGSVPNNEKRKQYFQIVLKEFNFTLENSSKQQNHLIMILNIYKNMCIIDTKIVNGITINIDVTERMKFIN